MDDLVERDGLYYQKFTKVPFTGEIDEGLERGNWRRFCLASRKGESLIYRILDVVEQKHLYAA